MNHQLHPLAGRFIQSWKQPCFQTMDDSVLTYGDIWQTADAIARRWTDQGLAPGSVVAFRLENSYRLPCAYLACSMAGLVACPVVPSLQNETVQANLDMVDAAVLIDGEPDWPVERGFDKPTDPTAMVLNGQQPFLIMFSSGSTGRNKAICHNLDAVTGSARAFAELSDFSDETRLYHVLPMTYMAGFLNSMLAVMMAGGKIVEGPQFTLKTVADFWRRPLETDANTLSVIPPLAAAVCRLTRNQDTIARISRQFEQVQCTSQSIQAALRQQFLKKFSLPLQDCYGMTELGGPLSLQPVTDAAQLGNRSHPLPGLDLERREGGALWIRSPFLMMGYLDNGQLTNPADARGYLATGDLAALDGEWLEITGREKDIIIRGGINTSPARIESIFSQFPGVSEVSVVGLPHSFWGEEIIACIVGDISAEQALGLARERLDSHEIPDRIVFLDELPRSFIGKVLKRDLSARVSNHG